ncbi:hypothetical protein [Pseudomonas oryzihabitans]|uniref:Phage tail tape measure protein n=1 Tax=Pseudomonas oryzihabitans TaxID=47885 RepID=A0AAJ2BG79_9PSED|nr:hypothetical protein [Pseudomonas psychrotolerans]MDR6233554.1 hypothetical protein [Pseudomonas psychrotolerans]
MRETGSATVKQSLGLLSPAIEEAKRFNQELNRIGALNLGEKATADAVKYAKAMGVYGSSTTEKLGAMRQALEAFGDVSSAKLAAPTLAKLQFANQALYGKDAGAAKSAQFAAMLPVIAARGGLTDEASFKLQADAVQKTLANTQGRVAAPEWLKVLDKGGQAARGLNADAFYNGLEPLIQQLGGEKVGDGLSASYRNLYQGSTTRAAANKLRSLGLINPGQTKVNGDRATIDAGALVGSDLLAQDQNAWLQRVLLPALKAKGITGDRQILDTIRTILPDQAGAELFTQIYKQRDQLEQSSAKTRGSPGIDSLVTQAQKSPEGAELELQARKADLYRQLGSTILPTYVKALEIVAAVTQKVTQWLEDNPKTGAVLVDLAMGASILSATFGALAVGLAGLMAPFTLLKGMLSLTGPALFGTLELLAKLGGGTLSVAGSSLRLLGEIGMGAFNLLINGVRLLGAAMLANPILAIIAGIAAAGALIYANWGTIGPWFTGLWEEIKAGFSGGLTGIASVLLDFSPIGLIYRGFSALLGYLGVDLPGKLSELGGQLFGGLMNSLGINLGSLQESLLPWLAELWDSIKQTFSTALDGLKTLLISFSPLNLLYQAFQPLLTYFGKDLPSTFTTLGSQLLDGLIGGLTSRLAAVQQTLGNLSGRVRSWLSSVFGGKEPDVNQQARTSALPGPVSSALATSPQLGGTKGLIKAGAIAVGVATAPLPGIGAPLPKGLDMPPPQLASAQRLTGSNVSLTSPATAPLPGIGAPLPLDSRPPLTSPAATAPAGNDLFNITINAPANANPQEIATLVRNEIAREKADQAARNRSSLRDWN